MWDKSGKAEVEKAKYFKLQQFTGPANRWPRALSRFTMQRRKRKLNVQCGFC